MRLDSVRISFVYEIRISSVYEPEGDGVEHIIERAIERASEAYGADWQVEEVSSVGDGLVEVTLAASGSDCPVLYRTDNVKGAAMTLLEDLGYVVGSPAYNEYYPAVVRHLKRLEAGKESEVPVLGGAR